MTTSNFNPSTMIFMYMKGFRATLADPASAPDPQNNRQNAGTGRKACPTRPRIPPRPAKIFRGRGKFPTPTRENAGFPLAAAVPCITEKQLAGGTFQPALFSPFLPPPPALASARPPPAIPAISAGGIAPRGRPTPSRAEPLHRPSGSGEKSRPPVAAAAGIDHRRAHHPRRRPGSLATG